MSMKAFKTCSKVARLLVNEAFNFEAILAFFIRRQFYKNNEAQIWTKFKNKLRTMSTIEVRLQMQI